MHGSKAWVDWLLYIHYFVSYFRVSAINFIKSTAQHKKLIKTQGSPDLKRTSIAPLLTT